MICNVSLLLNCCDLYAKCPEHAMQSRGEAGRKDEEEVVLEPDHVVRARRQLLERREAVLSRLEAALRHAAEVCVLRVA